MSSKIVAWVDLEIAVSVLNKEVDKPNHQQNENGAQLVERRSGIDELPLYRTKIKRNVLKILGDMNLDGIKNCFYCNWTMSLIVRCCT